MSADENEAALLPALGDGHPAAADAMDVDAAGAQVNESTRPGTRCGLPLQCWYSG
jgi:hypothetical protein